jgi:nucleotide-binding universal stress UspA family protein
VDVAVATASAARATLKVVSVVAPPGAAFAMAGAAYAYQQAVAGAREAQRLALEELVSSLPAAVRAQARLRSGDPAAEIAAECETGVDLLVTGSRGYGAVRRTLLGGVSNALVRTAPCPVLVVPATGVREENGAAAVAAVAPAAAR